MNKFKLGIIGKGFVGSAVSSGFSTTDQYVVDPKISADNTIDKLVNDFDPPLTFVCVPTPPNEDGSVNVDVVTEVLDNLNECNYKGIVVVNPHLPLNRPLCSKIWGCFGRSPKGSHLTLL